MVSVIHRHESAMGAQVFPHLELSSLKLKENLFNHIKECCEVISLQPIKKKRMLNFSHNSKIQKIKQTENLPEIPFTSIRLAELHKCVVYFVGEALCYARLGPSVMSNSVRPHGL